MDYECSSGIFITDQFNNQKKCNQCNNILVYSRYKKENLAIGHKTPRRKPQNYWCVQCMLKKLHFKEEYLEKFLEMSKTVVEVSDRV